MRLGSLFDGSGGFSLAGKLAGITPAWAAEIEPYPIAVTRSRLPEMRHLGSVTAVHGGDIDPVDVITFGSPCQDLSVAGAQKGLTGSRSGLFFEAVRITQEMREATNGQYPRYIVWENVPGAYGSNGGADFRAVLLALAGIREGSVSIPDPPRGRWPHAGCIRGNGYSIAWRTLDAQYWGVPQRRRRIYLVGDFGGGRAPEILFDRKGLSGHPAADPAPGEAAPAPADGRPGGGSQCLSFDYNAGTGASMAWADGVSHPLLAGNSGEPAVVYALQGPLVRSPEGTKMQGNGWHLGIGYTLTTADRHAVCMATGQAKAEVHTNVSPILTAGHEAPILGVEYNRTAGRIGLSGQRIQTLLTRMGTGGDNVPMVMGLDKRRKYILRRLTPQECGRLQGFPDGWGAPDHRESMTEEDAACWEGVRRTYAMTRGKQYRPFRDRRALINWYNGLHRDAAEYRMWGNGIALPCARFVLAGIAAAEDGQR